jgi:hypothetical protein
MSNGSGGPRPGVKLSYAEKGSNAVEVDVTDDLITVRVDVHGQEVVTQIDQVSGKVLPRETGS